MVAAWLLSLDVDALAHSPGSRLGAYLLLAIGLYSATYCIDLRMARRDRKVIGSAVTFGVLVKALLIGSSLALAWQEPSDDRTNLIHVVVNMLVDRLVHRNSALKPKVPEDRPKTTTPGPHHGRPAEEV